MTFGQFKKQLNDTVQEQNNKQNFEINSEKNICKKILESDKTIRFVGLTSNSGKLLQFAKKDNIISILDNEEEQLSLIHTATKYNLNELWNHKLGKTKIILEIREKIKLLTIFTDSQLIALSTEITSDHDKIIKNIQDITAG